MGKKEKSGGFTLVEVLLATLIIAVAVVPLMDVFSRSTRWMVESRKAMTALNLAQMVLEETSSVEYGELDGLAMTETAAFEEFPEYRYQLAVKDYPEGGGKKLVKRLKVTVYDGDTMKELVSLETDRGDWQ